MDHIHSTSVRDDMEEREAQRLVYRVESRRRESFENWPMNHAMDVDRLASEGLYFTGNGDELSCFECGLLLENWEAGDNPISDHQRWRHDCRIIRRVPCGNVPIGSNPEDIPLPPICHYGGIDSPSSVSVRTAGGHRPTDFAVTVRKPKFSAFVSYDVRLQSYTYWPLALIQSKELLAENGFFYLGKGDITICYHCGIGVREWNYDDDPSKEHARFSPNCYFLQLTRGKAYIDSILNGPPKPKTKDVDKYKCKICFEKDIQVVLLPCNHLSTCTQCTLPLNQCPICRGNIQHVITPIIS